MRIVPALNIALIRSKTNLSSTPDNLAISLKRFTDKSLDLVFRNSEDFGIDRICVLSGDHCANSEGITRREWKRKGMIAIPFLRRPAPR